MNGKQTIQINLNLPKSEKRLLDNFLVNLKNKFGSKIERVILFGSKARGDWHKDSDIDLLILTRDQSKSLENKISDLVYDIELKNNFPALLSIIVWSRKRFKSFSKPETSFIHNLNKEGLELWP